MEFEGSESSANPPTEKFLVWASVLLFFGVLGFVYSTYQSEQERLAVLQANEEQKEKTFYSLERQREQTARYIDRFSRDPEFVRDQARERLGVAEEGEVVIRVDGASSLSQPAPTNSPAKPASP